MLPQGSQLDSLLEFIQAPHLASQVKSTSSSVHHRSSVSTHTRDRGTERHLLVGHPSVLPPLTEEALWLVRFTKRLRKLLNHPTTLSSR